MPAAQNLIPLTSLAAELSALTPEGSPSYRKLYLTALDGRLPGAHQVGNGRWHVRRDALPQIAAALGLSPAA